MTGEQMYRIHVDVARALGERLLPWDELTFAEQDKWEVSAYEQGLRDRESVAVH